MPHPHFRILPIKLIPSFHQNVLAHAKTVSLAHQDRILECCLHRGPRRRSNNPFPGFNPAPGLSRTPASFPISSRMVPPTQAHLPSWGIRCDLAVYLNKLRRPHLTRSRPARNSLLRKHRQFPPSTARPNQIPTCKTCLKDLIQILRPPLRMLVPRRTRMR